MLPPPPPPYEVELYDFFKFCTATVSAALVAEGVVAHVSVSANTGEQARLIVRGPFCLRANTSTLTRGQELNTIQSFSFTV